MQKICQCTTMNNPGLTGFLLKEDETKTKCSAIINLLFGVLVDNMPDILLMICLHFFSPLWGSETNAMQLIKYPRISTTKTPNL